jgi:hypothetical protein
MREGKEGRQQHQLLSMKQWADKKMKARGGWEREKKEGRESNCK